jgi:PAS domain S-box-containing protein
MTTEHTSKQFLTYQHFDHAPVALIITHGSEMAIQFANLFALSLLKCSLDDLKGKNLSHFLPEIYTDDVKQNLYKTCFDKAQSYVISKKQIICSNTENPESWFDIKNNPMRDEHGTVIGIISFLTDVTERVISNKSIEQRQEYLGSSFKHAPIGLVCYRGADFIVDFANDKALEIWGKTLEDVKGKAIHEIFPEVLNDPQINARHRESLLRLEKGETHVVNEVELTFHRDGKPLTGWYNYIHEPYTNDVGEIVGMMAIAIEVTDQVLARKKIQLVTDAIPSLVAYVNSSERYELVNEAYEQWFKLSRSKILGKSIPEVIGKEAYAKVKSHIDKVLAGQKQSFESWIDYADGKRRFVSASYIPHEDNNNRILGYISLVNDLTERKRNEAALLENEARLGLIIEGIGAGTFEYDLDADQINCSNELRTLLGLPEDSVIDKKTAGSVVHPDDFSLVEEQLNELRLAAQDRYMAIDHRIVRKNDAEVRWLHTRSKLLSSGLSGKLVTPRIIGFSIDITDRKIAEQKLKELSHNLEEKVAERTAEASRVNDLLTHRNEELHQAQSVLQQLIDSSVEFITVIDRDLKFLAVNKTFETFVKKPRAELIGKEIFVVYEGARGSRQVELLQKAFAGETLHLRLNPSLSRPDTWFDTHYVPLILNNKVEGAIVLSRDITEIVRSQHELAEVNRQLQEAQHLSKLGSWEWDVSTGTVIWSDEMYRIYGYEEKFPVDFIKATERMSSDDAERSSSRTQQHIQEAVERFKKTGEQVHEISPVEFSIQLPDGKRKLLRNTGKIQLTPDGKMHRVLGVVQDVTQIRSAEEKLRQLVAELEAKNRDLESFNYVASHDLKEPLRKIHNFVNRIRSNGTNDTGIYLSKIEEAAKRMTDLIESILKLSQVSNANVELTDVDLSKVLEACKSDLEVRIKETNAEIISSRLPTIKANESQMNQVFLNLITNSIKFCNTTPVISISCNKISKAEAAKLEVIGSPLGYWRLTFTDNGIGFNPKYKQQVFEPFQRLHSSHEYSGTGIGLSIVKKIVERHGGLVDVESEIGKGTNFSLFLPISV